MKIKITTNWLQWILDYMPLPWLLIFLIPDRYLILDVYGPWADADIVFFGSDFVSDSAHILHIFLSMSITSAVIEWRVCSRSKGLMI